MEGITKRLFVTLAVVAVAVGVCMIGSAGRDIQFPKHEYEQSQIVLAQAQACHVLHGDAVECTAAFDVAHDLESHSRGLLLRQAIGVSVLLGAVLLWPLFYLVRWIAVGRVRRRILQAGI